MDTREYLKWCVETHQAAKERARKVLAKIGCGAVVVGMMGLWIGAWMIG